MVLAPSSDCGKPAAITESGMLEEPPRIIWASLNHGQRPLGLPAVLLPGAGSSPLSLPSLLGKGCF